MTKAKPPRKEITSLRLEPKIKYLAEIASRVQRRNLTNYIEWVLEESLEKVYVDDNNSVADLASSLWDIDEPDRFIKLSLYASDLLTYEEQRLYKLILSHPLLFSTSSSNKKSSGNFNYETLHIFWDDLISASKGDKDAIEKLDQEEASLELPF